MTHDEILTLLYEETLVGNAPAVKDGVVSTNELGQMAEMANRRVVRRYSDKPLDPALLEQSADLGASPVSTFLRITFPLTLPGIAAGSVFVFVVAGVLEIGLEVERHVHAARGDPAHRGTP